MDNTNQNTRNKTFLKDQIALVETNKSNKTILIYFILFYFIKVCNDAALLLNTTNMLFYHYI